MKISIVTNAYNQGKYLRRCMESVLRQTYQDVEYIVVDPGSTDDTAEILLSYEKLNDPRLTIIREKDLGPADGLNNAFENATGEVFGYLNADDFYLNDALAIVAAEFEQDMDSDCIYGNGYITDSKGVPIKRGFSTNFSSMRYVMARAVVMQQSTFYKATSFRDVRGFNTENRITWDGEIVLDMTLAGMKIRRFDDFISAFTLYDESITGSQRFSKEFDASFRRMFRKVTGRDFSFLDAVVKKFWRVIDLVIAPKLTLCKITDRVSRKSLPDLVNEHGMLISSEA